MHPLYPRVYASVHGPLEARSCRVLGAMIRFAIFGVGHRFKRREYGTGEGAYDERVQRLWVHSDTLEGIAVEQDAGHS